MDNYAVIFNWWPTTPTYHGFDNERLNIRSEDASADFTRCGRLVSEYVYATQRLREPGDWFPMKHAKKFAKPCKRCFPSEEVPA
jgi:hypothetical protein